MPVRPAIKLFVGTFLAAFLVCGLAGFEVWPLTGWRLFSHLRTEQLVDWAVTVVDDAGNEAPVPFAELPVSYRKWRHLAGGLPAMDDAERRRVCEAWGATARADVVEADVVEADVVEVRVYRIEQSLLDGSSRRELWFKCEP